MPPIPSTAGTGESADFDQAIFDKINAVARLAFVKNFFAFGEFFFLRDESQRVQFIRA